MRRPAQHNAKAMILRCSFTRCSMPFKRRSIC